ncbi:phage portal protein, lambda family [Rhizobium tibeticum]|uniref:Phage portal protein, lambda family n=1 Tax=Rhizobium tibeticum TaxID=501024 RepID=A0A1H8DE62_9HYPH|nr:phage portal protein [Rhizobium tibeticum]SEH51472.1 phage portal protein, lambda family [Rhizobium tibeticum]SEN05553.1 phage portal protein, lambda family [Rhizobium tibeticum]
MKPPRMPLSFIDRAISVFDPARALRRHQARTMLALTTGGYKGGKKNRRQTANWNVDGGSANQDSVPDLPTLRARSRDLRRNVPIATGAIATRITNIIGEGLKVYPKIDRAALGLSVEEAREWNRKAKAEFELAAWTADFTGAQSFDELQALVFGSADESGDVFAIRRYRKDPGDTYGSKLQIIEADRISNPNNGMDTDTQVAGIETTLDGVVRAYHVSDRHPGDVFRKAMTWRRVPAFYNDGRPIVLHLFKRLRPDQARGIPYLAPVIEILKQFGEYTDAEVQAAVISAFFTVFIKKAPDATSGPLPSSATDGASGKDEVNLGAGAIVDLAEGEDITIADPNRPNPNFDAFALALLRQIGVALEMPVELLIKHFMASYSASRAALEIAWQTFRRERAWLVKNFCQPYYEWVIEEAVLTGRLQAKGFFDDPAIRAAWLKSDWYGQTKISLDPKKDAEADTIDIGNRTKTRQQIIQERTGGDLESKFEQLGIEEQLAQENGLATAPTAAAPGAAAQPADTTDEEQ